MRHIGKKNGENLMDKYPFVSIVIPTMNRKDDLLECLVSIQQLDYPKDRMELVIWDNGSNDSSTEAVRLKFQEMDREGWANLQLIESDINLGQYIPYNEVRLKMDKVRVLLTGALGNLSLYNPTKG
jgi:glycosyltransferase involved in cell wall biosynthesis